MSAWVKRSDRFVLISNLSCARSTKAPSMKLVGHHLEHMLAPRAAPGAKSVTDIDIYIYIYIYTYTSSDSIPTLQDYLHCAKALGNDDSQSNCNSQKLYMASGGHSKKSLRRTAPFLRNPRNNRPTTSQSVIITHITSN